MANRERKNELKIYLSDDEQYILVLHPDRN